MTPHDISAYNSLTRISSYDHTKLQKRLGNSFHLEQQRVKVEILFLWKKGEWILRVSSVLQNNFFKLSRTVFSTHRVYEEDTEYYNSGQCP